MGFKDRSSNCIFCYNVSVVRWRRNGPRRRPVQKRVYEKIQRISSKFIFSLTLRTYIFVKSSVIIIYLISSEYICYR